MSANLIIDDDFCSDIGAYFVKKGSEMDQIISDYISAVQAIRNTVIQEGKTADALDKYIELAKQMEDQIGKVSSSAQALVTRFLGDVDNADDFLF